MSVTDELRAMAESVGLAMPQAATLMMGAADTIEGFEAENAKLRQQLADVTVSIGRVEERCAKLRELLDYVTPIAWYAASERERDRMRELGVEVSK